MKKCDYAEKKWLIVAIVDELKAWLKQLIGEEGERRREKEVGLEISYSNSFSDCTSGPTYTPMR